MANEIKNAASRNLTSDAWVLLVSAVMGDGVRAGAFRTLTNLVALDIRLAWSGVIPLLRNMALQYDGEVREHT
jgi:hypothetical protein